MSGRIGYDHSIFDGVTLPVKVRCTGTRSKLNKNGGDLLVAEVNIAFKDYGPSVAVIVVHTGTIYIIANLISVSVGEQLCPVIGKLGQVQKGLFVINNDLGILTIGNQNQTVNLGGHYVVLNGLLIVDHNVACIRNLNIVRIAAHIVSNRVVLDNNGCILATGHSHKAITNSVSGITGNGHGSAVSGTCKKHSVLGGVLNGIVGDGYVLGSAKLAKSCDAVNGIAGNGHVLRAVGSIEINQLELVVITDQGAILNGKTVNRCIGGGDHNGSVVSGRACSECIGKLHAVDHKILYNRRIVAITGLCACRKDNTVNLCTGSTNNGDILNASDVVISPRIGNINLGRIAVTGVRFEREGTVVYAGSELDDCAGCGIIKSRLSLCGSFNDCYSISVVLIVIAIFLVCNLSCKQVDAEVNGGSSRTLSRVRFVAYSRGHIDHHGHDLLVFLNVSSSGIINEKLSSSGVVCGFQSSCPCCLCGGDRLLTGVVLCACDHAELDVIGKLECLTVHVHGAGLACYVYTKIILKCEAALVYYLKLYDLGVTGLPEGILKDVGI